MTRLGNRMVRQWRKIGVGFLPFADVATTELPLSRLLRLSLFQVTVGMAVVLVIGTLNRVMIVELGVPAWLVAAMIALPLLAAPFRVLVGFRSDVHRSLLGWRRVPYIWFGTMAQFGGFAIMPFALLILSGDTHGPKIIGDIAAALAFLLVGAGLHTVQTVGLALACDLAPEHARPKVVALLCVMLLVGMVISALAFGALLSHFTEIKLIQVVQGAAFLTMMINLAALWKQEPRRRRVTAETVPQPRFRDAWRQFTATRQSRRRLVAVALGTVGFSMQDVLLEPYGGQILHLSVSATTALTALLAGGGIVGLGVAARWLGRGGDPYRVAACGALVGLAAFSAVIFAAPMQSGPLFALGTTLIGGGGGLFAHGTLTAAMAQSLPGQAGIALGAWGTVQALAAGGATAIGGIIRDFVSSLAGQNVLGEALSGPAIGYSVVYHLEIALLFLTLIAIGPLVRVASSRLDPNQQQFSGYLSA